MNLFAFSSMDLETLTGYKNCHHITSGYLGGNVYHVYLTMGAVQRQTIIYALHTQHYQS